VTIDVRNTGRRPGTDVVQLYVPEQLGSYPSALNTFRGSAVARDVAPGTSTTLTIDSIVHASAAQVWIGRSADPNGLMELAIERDATTRD
jgi:hypothetical protein